MKKNLTATFLLNTMSLHAEGIIAALKNSFSLKRCLNRHSAKSGSYTGSSSL